jgi:diguanylate cyclase (GGDEF)-like protein/PAS domain S-box-containing protein
MTDDHQLEVLVVEDDPAARTILTRILVSEGFAFVPCSTGEEAIVRAAEKFFPLVILDLLLPGMNGLEVCRWLRKQPTGDRQYVLVGTGSTDARSLSDVLGAGANDYVTKPYSPPLLRIRLAVAKEQVKILAERKKLEEQLAADRDFITAVVETAAVVIVVLGPDGRVVRVNEGFRELSGVTDKEIVGTVLAENESFGRHQEEVFRQLTGLEGERGVRAFESEFVSRAGLVRTVAWRISLVRDREGGLVHVIVTGVDITEKDQAEKRLAFLATRDPLTRLYNRNYLNDMLGEVITQAQGGVSAALLYLDLDNFKIVNDTLGHAAGDRLLVSIAERLRGAVRSQDLIVRFGGDEFVIILREATRDDAEMIAEKVRHLLDNMIFTESDRSFAVGASIGLLMIDGQLPAERVMARADAACYAAKARGRNRVETFAVEGTELDELRRDTDWRTRIRDALQEDRFVIHYQPVVKLPERQRAYHEALLRMEDGKGNLISPEVFLPAAERFKLVRDIDRRVVLLALTYLLDHPGENLSVNITAESLGDFSFLGFLEQTFFAADVIPSRVILEITERSLISDLGFARQSVSSIKKLGFRVALDDFGAGFSSFGHLKHLPADYLKIDGEFIRGLSRDEKNQILVKSITELGHRLGMKVVAEYAEDEETVEMLEDLGVDFGQGRFFSLARPDLFPAVLKRGKSHVET